MSRFYIYDTSTGELRANNTVSYAGSLPPGTSEIEITPLSKWHTIWNPTKRTLDDNGGGRILTEAEAYEMFKRRVKRLYDEIRPGYRTKIYNLLPVKARELIQ